MICDGGGDVWWWVQAEEDFEKQWEAGTVPGWTKTGGATANGTGEDRQCLQMWVYM